MAMAKFTSVPTGTLGHSQRPTGSSSLSRFRSLGAPPGRPGPEVFLQEHFRTSRDSLRGQSMWILIVWKRHAKGLGLWGDESVPAGTLASECRLRCGSGILRSVPAGTLWKTRDGMVDDLTLGFLEIPTLAAPSGFTDTTGAMVWQIF